MGSDHLDLVAAGSAGGARTGRHELEAFHRRSIVWNTPVGNRLGPTESRTRAALPNGSRVDHANTSPPGRALRPRPRPDGDAVVVATTLAQRAPPLDVKGRTGWCDADEIRWLA
jgi:hypothetical protein